jgi:hypothetical protein
MTKICPKNYQAYDQMSKDCDKCGEGKLYVRCTTDQSHLACAGWCDNNGPQCCICYQEPADDI